MRSSRRAALEAAPSTPLTPSSSRARAPSSVLLLLACLASLAIPVAHASYELPANDTLKLIGYPTFIAGSRSVVDGDLPHVTSQSSHGLVGQAATPDGQPMATVIGYYESYQCVDNVTFTGTAIKFAYPEATEQRICEAYRRVGTKLYSLTAVRAAEGPTTCPDAQDLDTYIAALEAADGDKVEAPGGFTSATSVGLELNSVPMSVVPNCTNTEYPPLQPHPTDPIPDGDPGPNPCPSLPPPPSEVPFGNGVWVRSGPATQPGSIIVIDGLETGTVAWGAGILDYSDPYDASNTRAKIEGHRCVDDHIEEVAMSYQRRWVNGTLEAGWQCLRRSVDPATRILTVEPLEGQAGKTEEFIYLQEVPGEAADTCAPGGNQGEGSAASGAAVATVAAVAVAVMGLSI